MRVCFRLFAVFDKFGSRTLPSLVLHLASRLIPSPLYKSLPIAFFSLLSPSLSLFHSLFICNGSYLPPAFCFLILRVSPVRREKKTFIFKFFFFISPHLPSSIIYTSSFPSCCLVFIVLLGSLLLFFLYFILSFYLSFTVLSLACCLLTTWRSTSC